MRMKICTHIIAALVGAAAAATMLWLVGFGAAAVVVLPAICAGVGALIGLLVIRRLERQRGASEGCSAPDQLVTESARNWQ